MSCSGWPASEELREKFQAIDEMVKRVDHFKADPEFSQEVKRRRDDWLPKFDSPDEHILHRMVDLIAYSNAARSDRVEHLLEHGVFGEIFRGYSVETTATLSAEDVRGLWWHAIKDIRFKYKIDRMIDCAKCLLRVRDRAGLFMGYLQHCGATFRHEVGAGHR